MSLAFIEMMVFFILSNPTELNIPGLSASVMSLLAARIAVSVKAGLVESAGSMMVIAGKVVAVQTSSLLTVWLRERSVSHATGEGSSDTSLGLAFGFSTASTVID